MLSLVLLLLVVLAGAKESEQVQRLRIEGEEAFKARRYSDAVRFFSKALKIEASDVLYFRRGLVYLSQDNMKGAIKDFDTSIAKNTNYQQAYKQRARAYTLLGEFGKALADYQTLQRLGDAKAAESSKTVTAYLRQKERIVKDIENEDCVPESVEAAKKVIENAPFDNKAGYFVSHCLVIYRDYQNVMIYTGKLLKQKQTADVIVLRGKAYMYIEEVDRAKKHFKLGLRLEPEHKHLKLAFKNYKVFTKGNQRAEKALKKKNWRVVMQEYEELLGTYPFNERFNGGAFVKICLAARRMGKRMTWKEKLAICNEAVDYAESAEAFAERGRLYGGENKWEMSLRNWEQAVKRDEQNRSYRQELDRASKQWKIQKRKDYYKILGVNKFVAPKKLKKAFRKCAIKFHPDKFMRNSEEEKEEAEDKYKECVEANDILSDADLRKRYDGGEDVLGTLQGGNQNQGNRGGGFPYHFFHGGGGQRFRFN